MPIAAWPSTLPQRVLRSGFSEKPGDSAIESPMESGNTKSRPRGTADLRRMSVTVRMSAAQSETYLTFWKTTLAKGSLPFTWVHPRTGVAATFMHRNPHWQITPVGGGNVDVALNLEQTA